MEIAGFKIHIQRIIVAVAALLGIIGSFMNWMTMKFSMLGVTAKESVSGIEKWYVGGGDFGSATPNFKFINGWIMIIIFIAAIVLCMLKDRDKPFAEPKFKYGVTAAGGVAFLFAILKMTDINKFSDLGLGMTIRTGFGLILILLMGIIIAATPFLEKQIDDIIGKITKKNA